MHSSKMSTDWQARWLTAQQQPLAWLITAQRLNRAAQLLFAAQADAERTTEDGTPNDVEEMQLHLNKPAMLLLAFAMENAIKAYLLDSGRIQWTEMQKKANELSSDVQNKQKVWKSHDLPPMFELAAVLLTDEQKSLLASLSAFSKWAGRYPTAFVDKECFAQVLSFDALGRNDQPKDQTAEVLPPVACDSDSLQKLEDLFDAVVAKVTA